MAYIKLLKLLYLAERQAMVKWGDSISGDHFVSMPHGPVLSQTYDLIKGHVTQGADSPWQKMIKDEQNYEVSLKNDFELDDLDDLDDLDELSLSEISILETTFDKYHEQQQFDSLKQQLV
jgi:hypothetical protein